MPIYNIYIHILFVKTQERSDDYEISILLSKMLLIENICHYNFEYFTSPQISI